MARESMGRDFLCGEMALWEIDSREEFFGLLNFCCTRQVVLFLRGGFI